MKLNQIAIIICDSIHIKKRKKYNETCNKLNKKEAIERGKNHFLCIIEKKIQTSYNLKETATERQTS